MLFQKRSPNSRSDSTQPTRHTTEHIVHGDIDLSGLIWQARSRLMFANDAEDADLIANELATLSYNPMKLKEELLSQRQRIVGHRREWVRNKSRTSTTSSAEDIQESRSHGVSDGESRRDIASDPTKTRGTSDGTTHGRSTKHAESSGKSEGESETLVPIHEDFFEVSSRTYVSFDEQRIEWAKHIRQKRTGQAFGKFKDDPQLYDIAIDQHFIPEGPVAGSAVEELIQRNFESEFFRSAQAVHAEEERLRERLLREPPLTLNLEPPRDLDVNRATDSPSTTRPQSEPENENPLR